ncbi:MAG: hypothetical protein FWG75_04645 [Cystobacterineae bacterium]|nr:hypothetical protein [Cystobacterineae bacterium]
MQRKNGLHAYTPRHGTLRRLYGFLCLCSSILLFGCASELVFCDEGRPCPEGSRCVSNGNAFVCEAENPAFPSMEPGIRFQLLEGSFSADGRTNNAALKIQVNIYGASQGASTWLEAPGSRREALLCEKRETGFRDAQHLRLECSPTTVEEGSYRLGVEAYIAQAATTEYFSWTYDLTPPRASILLEDKELWGRDEALFLQIEGDADLAWRKVELFVGENQQHRATRASCPPSLPAKPHAECFEVSLSQLPDLPHGNYRLRLTAKLTNETGNESSLRQDFNVRLSRQLWTRPFPFLSAPLDIARVTTREGLFVVMNPEGLRALNAQGEEVWRTEIANAKVQLLLGNHYGRDVLVVGCSLQEALGSGFVNVDGLMAVDAKSGEILSRECESPQRAASNVVLVQGGPDKGLLVARKHRMDYSSNGYPAYALEACSLYSTFYSPGTLWRFDCQSQALPEGGNIAGSIVARQAPNGWAEVFFGAPSPREHGCSMQWREVIRMWAMNSPCDGMATFPPTYLSVALLGAEHLWLYAFLYPPIHQGDTGADGMHVFNLNQLDMGISWTSMLPLLVDTGDELITAFSGFGYGNTIYNARPPPFLSRYSAGGELLQRREGAWIRNATMLMEGGDLVYSNKNHVVSCLKSDFSHCWEGAEVLDSDGQLLGVLPLSATRSMVVLGFRGSGNTDYFVSAFLVDASGLKKDAPWPIGGHDLCNSYNASVPVDNCWDGPSS